MINHFMIFQLGGIHDDLNLHLSDRILIDSFNIRKMYFFLKYGITRNGFVGAILINALDEDVFFFVR